MSGLVLGSVEYGFRIHQRVSLWTIEKGQRGEQEVIFSSNGVVRTFDNFEHSEHFLWSNSISHSHPSTSDMTNKRRETGAIALSNVAQSDLQLEMNHFGRGHVIVDTQDQEMVTPAEQKEVEMSAFVDDSPKTRKDIAAKFSSVVLWESRHKCRKMTM